MSTSKFKFSVSVLLLSSAPVSFSQDIDVVKDLNAQGQFWIDRGNSQRAAQAWKKLLLINPKDENALYGMAISELDKKNLDATMAYYNKIVAINPKSTFLERIDQDIRLRNPTNSKALEMARIATQNQDYSGAVEKYREALGTNTPHGAEAFEYYSAMAHLPEKAKESIEGFIRLKKESPNDLQIDLFLAKRLIVAESTRIEGLKQLLKLTANPSVKSEAMESIRQALVWFGPPRPEEFQLFEQYLKITPDDKEISAQLNAGKKKLVDITTAAASQRSSAGVIGAPPPISSNPRLIAAKKQASDALAKGNDLEAKKYFLDALAIDRNDPWTRLELAKIYMKNGQPSEAKGLVNGYLSSNPSDTQALFASAIFSSTIPDWQNALKTLELIKPSERTKDIAEFHKTAWVQTQIAYAETLDQSSKKSDALTILSKVKPVVVDNTNLTGLLANSYVELGFPQEGMKLVNEMVGKSSNPSTDVLLQQASILLKTNQDVEFGNIINKIQSRPMTVVQRNLFEDLSFPYSVRQAESLNQNGNPREALEKLILLKAKRPNETYVDGAIARTYSKLGMNQEAINIYNELLQKNENQPEILLGLSQVAAQSRNFSLVTQTLDKYISLDPNNSEYLRNAGKVYRSIGKNALALSMFEQSMANNPDSPIISTKSTDIKTVGINPDSFYTNKVVMTAAVPTKSSKNRIIIAKVEPKPVPLNEPIADVISGQIVVASNLAKKQEETALEVNEIKQERTPEVLAGFSYRSKNGASGTSNLSDQEVPLEIRFPINDSKVSIKLTQVSLNSGAIDDNYFSNLTFGSGVLTSPQGTNLPSVPGGISARGVGLSVGVQQGGLTGDVGVTPLGFLFSKFTGGIKYQTTLDDNSTKFMSFNLSSRPVTDSVLSFAGSTDPRSGLSWGGVMANGARISFSNTFESNPSYGSSITASYHQISGTNVKSNTRAEVTAEVHKDLLKTANSLFKLGLSASGIFYKDNLSGFTYGNGGYFSPQQYIALTVPLSFEKRTGNISYVLKTAAGWQKFNENSAPYYPNDPGMQDLATKYLSSSSDFYGATSASSVSSSNSGVAFNLLGAMEYQIAPQLFMGGNVLFDNSGNYRQWGLGVNLRIPFERITTLPLSMPTSSLYSPYSYLAQ